MKRGFSITDIADGDELVDMKFSVHFLPINFDLEKVREYFERIGFTSVSVFRNKIKLNCEFFNDLASQKEIFTNLIFVKAKLKKNKNSPIVCGFRKLFGFEPRIDILDGVKRCRLCKKEGHIVDKCLGKDVYCAKCKQQGHSENECSIAYMLQKGLYSQIDNFDDSDELKFNCLSEEILNKKKEQWKKTKIFKEKKEKEKSERENSIKQFSEDTTFVKMCEEKNKQKVKKIKKIEKNIIMEVETENDDNLNDVNGKRNHSLLSTAESSPSILSSRIKKKRNEQSDLYNIILEIYAEDNEYADKLEDHQKEEIEDICFETVSLVGEDPYAFSETKGIYKQIYRKYIEKN